MTETDPRYALKFAAGLLLCTVTVVGVSIAVALVFSSPPRTFLFWLTAGFLTFIESLAGLLTLNLFSRARTAFRPSGATIAIVYAVVVAGAMVGLLSILLYRSLGDSQGSSDGQFAGVLCAEIAVCFVVAFAMYSYDLFLQGQLQVAQRGRAEYRLSTAELHNVLASLEQCSPIDSNARSRLDTLLKRLRGAETLLAHAPGGIGSWESGPGRPLDDGGQVNALISGMAQSVADLRSAPTSEALSQLEQHERRLASLLDHLCLN